MRLWDFFFKPSTLSLQRQLRKAEARLAAEERIIRSGYMYPTAYSEAYVEVARLKFDLEFRR